MQFRKPAATSRSKLADGEVYDSEFGSIICKRNSSRYVRIRVMEHGDIVATLPKTAPLKLVVELVESSRSKIRKMLDKQKSQRPLYADGVPIGHSHTLKISFEKRDKPTKRLRGQILSIALPEGWDPNDSVARAYISKQIKNALRREAEAYLPRRLSHLAEIWGFRYNSIRFGNPKGRWGSCSSRGTISLNVALMNAPHDVIDYVLIHELAHTRHMNHGQQFWQTVESCHPSYKQSKKALKNLSPIC